MKKIFGLVGILFQLAYSQNFTGGVNFYIPPQDSSTSLFLPKFPIFQIKDNEYNTIDVNGHFSIAGKPIRFWGTNVVADGAFPAKEKSWFIAGHLRKMGFNLVRFHHLDNPWSKESLFEWGKDTRHLNTVTLDRMESLIAELKKNGIHINMNLHVGRTFRSSDGIPDADSIQEYGKGINYFDPQIISLHKEYAKQLLTHTNPYTGKSMPNDPVMAMLEITNENSLYGYWKGEQLKSIANGGMLLFRHVQMLDSLWIGFLRKKYSTTDSLHSAWNVGVKNFVGTDQIQNGSFELPVASNWIMEVHPPATATSENDNTTAFTGTNSAKVNVTNADGTDWHLQFKQVGLSIKKDSNYVISFAAKADKEKQISVSVIKETSPWTWYGGMTIKLSPQWKTYSFIVHASETQVNDIRLTFSVGVQSGTYWFDNVSFAQQGVKGLMAEESFETNVIKRLEYSEGATFTEQRVQDISAFYIGLMKNYFSHIRAYLKDSLGVKIPIVGTNWNVGPGDQSTMSELDYVDNHAYWDHPSFPNIPWSSTDWLINNTPMVTSQNGGTIPGLMGGPAMKNKPYTISEYNHPFPNQYQTEGVLFLLAYSSFHDVDGIMYFDYNHSSNDWESDKQYGYFNISRNSALMSLMPSCALAYRNGYISKYKQLISLQYSPETILTLPKNFLDQEIQQSASLRKLPMIHGVRTNSFTAGSTTDFSTLPATPSNPLVSDTKEIVWNTDGVLSVQAGKFIGVTGFINKYPGLNLGVMKIESANNFGTLSWISLTDDSLHYSRKSLITISTRMQNTGMIWDGIRTVHNNWGSAPTELLPQQIKLVFTMKADSIRVYPLDVFGNAEINSKKILPLPANTFEVVIDQSISKTPWFGIEVFGNGVTSVSETQINFPKEFALFQNYPNPFNPTTIIKYSIPTNLKGLRDLEGLLVTLKVYDVLGKEVATLVNENKSPGNYTVQFNASNLAVGVYFYTLHAGYFRQIKKLVVVK